MSARWTGAYEPGDGLYLVHQTSAPPAKLKNDRKKLELAAKAIDKPKTIWINRLKPLPRSRQPPASGRSWR